MLAECKRIPCMHAVEAVLLAVLNSLRVVAPEVHHNVHVWTANRSQPLRSTMKHWPSTCREQKRNKKGRSRHRCDCVKLPIRTMTLQSSLRDTAVKKKWRKHFLRISLMKLPNSASPAMAQKTADMRPTHPRKAARRLLASIGSVDTA